MGRSKEWSAIRADHSLGNAHDGRKYQEQCARFKRWPRPVARVSQAAHMQMRPDKLRLFCSTTTSGQTLSISSCRLNRCPGRASSTSSRSSARPPGGAGTPSTRRRCSAGCSSKRPKRRQAGVMTPLAADVVLGLAADVDCGMAYLNGRWRSRLAPLAGQRRQFTDPQWRPPGGAPRPGGMAARQGLVDPRSTLAIPGLAGTPGLLRWPLRLDTRSRRQLDRTPGAETRNAPLAARASI